MKLLALVLLVLCLNPVMAEECLNVNLYKLPDSPILEVPSYRQEISTCYASAEAQAANLELLKSDPKNKNNLIHPLWLAYLAKNASGDKELNFGNPFALLGLPELNKNYNCPSSVIFEQLNFLKVALKLVLPPTQNLEEAFNYILSSTTVSVNDDYGFFAYLDTYASPNFNFLEVVKGLDGMLNNFFIKGSRAGYYPDYRRYNLILNNKKVIATYSTLEETTQDIAHKKAYLCKNPKVPCDIKLIKPDIDLVGKIRKIFSEVFLTLNKNDGTKRNFEKLVERKCAKFSQNKMSFSSDNSMDSQLDLDQFIDKTLKQKKMVILSYCSKYLEDFVNGRQASDWAKRLDIKNGCDSHESVLVGSRKNKSGQCQYLLRNSWKQDGRGYVLLDPTAADHKYSLDCVCQSPTTLKAEDCKVSRVTERKVLGCWYPKDGLLANSWFTANVTYSGR